MKINILAYYLPQYHEIPENNEWWGKGFTEWTNVKKAKPLFKGHVQPIIPGELGYYDLMLDEDIQVKQAKMAKEYGVDGFIYYQYWFGDGKMLLEKPAEKMLYDKRVDIPFCFCWANETWKGVWHGLDSGKILIEQSYRGEQDYVNLFNYNLPFFKDVRYIKVNNRPMFHIYKYESIPDFNIFYNVFNKLCQENGFDGIYIVVTGGESNQSIINNECIEGIVGLDVFQKMRYSKTRFFNPDSLFGIVEFKIKSLLGYTDEVGLRTKPLVSNYKKSIKKLEFKFSNNKYISCVVPNWDNSPRSGNRSLIFNKSSPQHWGIHFEKALKQIKKHPDNPQFIIIKSWNEWAEGNYLEPDSFFGRQWLNVLKQVKSKYEQS